MANGYNVNIYCEDYASYLDRKLSGFEVEKFLKQYPDPDSAFVEKRVSRSYSKHVKIYLHNRFPAFPCAFIDQCIEKSGPRLQQVYRQLKHVDNQDTSSRNRLVRLQQPMPAEVDEMFYDELTFILHREDIISVAEAARNSLEERYEAAQQAGELVSCPCCFEDTLPEHQVACVSGHAFCKDCVQKAMEVALGQGRKQLSCLEHACSQAYPLATVQEIIRPYTLASLRRRLRDEFPDSMGIENCPYCLWPCDMAEVDRATLRCPNTDCLRDSCRLCRGPDHRINYQACRNVPPPDLRTYLMDVVSEAMMRSCYQCHVRIVKDGGCNLMACVCGAKVCYQCRKGIDGYKHFSTSECVLFDGVDGYSEKRQQQRDIRRAVEEAIEYFSHRYPQAPPQEVDVEDFLDRLGEGAGRQQQREEREHNNDQYEALGERNQLHALERLEENGEPQERPVRHEEARPEEVNELAGEPQEGAGRQAEAGAEEVGEIAGEQEEGAGMQEEEGPEQEDEIAGEQQGDNRRARNRRNARARKGRKAKARNGRR
jgi:TRIAD3 protein (E3 ubiquitin-protein ligase RNF216)